MTISFSEGPDDPRDCDVVVVIDVLRAFTVAALAIHRGVTEVHSVRDVDEALRLRDEIPNSLIAGEVSRGRRVPGFDLGNSPTSLQALDVDGRTLIHRTSAGTQGLVAWAPHATRTYAASFLNVTATAEAVLQGPHEDVVCVLTGVDDRDGDEDRACAEYLAGLIEGRAVDVESHVSRVRTSDAARAFGPDSDDLPLADITIATRIDTAPHALRGHAVDRRVVLRRE